MFAEAVVDDRAAEEAMRIISRAEAGITTHELVERMTQGGFSDDEVRSAVRLHLDRGQIVLGERMRLCVSKQRRTAS